MHETVLPYKEGIGSHQAAGLADSLLLGSLCCLFFFIPLATSPAEIAGGLVLGVWVLSGKFMKDRKEWLNQPWTKPVLCFAALPWIGLLWTNDPAAGLEFATKSHNWLLAFAVASLWMSKNNANLLIISFLAGLGLLSTASLLQYAGLTAPSRWIPTIFSSKSITASLWLVLGMLLLSFNFSHARRALSKAAILFIMALFFVTLALGVGRSGYLAFVLLSPFMISTMMGRRKHLLVTSALSLIMISLLFLSPTVRSRIALVISGVNEYHQTNSGSSTGERLHMWKGAVKIFSEQPLIGVGTGGYPGEIAKYEFSDWPPEQRRFAHPHNSFLHMAASFGIIGIASLFWLLYVFLSKGWRHRSGHAGFFVFSFGLVLLIGSLTDTFFLSTGPAKLFALLAGIRTELR